MKIEELIPAFKILTKNRQGPFKIALRSFDDGYFISGASFALDKAKAYDYVEYRSSFTSLLDPLARRTYWKDRTGSEMNFVILNAGPDIRLMDKDWK